MSNTIPARTSSDTAGSQSSRGTSTDGGKVPKVWNFGWIALLPISRPIGQATAATRAASTATLKPM